MVFTVDQQTLALHAAIDNGGQKETYTCSVTACLNPVCTCGSLQVKFEPSPTGQEPRAAPAARIVALDLVEQRLDTKDQPPASKTAAAFATRVFEQLDDHDFDLLHQQYAGYKNEISEATPPDRIEAHFDYDEIEFNGAMMTYNYVQPYGDQLPVTIDGRNCVIFDQYCLLPKCTCSDTILSIFDIANHDRELYLVELDYRKKKWQRHEDALGKTPPEQIKSVVEQEYPDIYARLQKRHRRLKAIYAACRKRHLAVSKPEAKTKARPKVGRNAPCPCGSGKKYKKCCLGK